MVLVSGSEVLMAQQAAIDIIEINGRTNPELIPEYVLWEFGFGGLALIKEKNMTVAIDSLGLSAADLALVWKEASLQRDREEQSMTRQRRQRELSKAQGASQQELTAALQKIVLDYRWSVLEARDRLVAAMSAEGQASLLAWMELRRSSIMASVVKSDWEFFRKPR
jgi:hypothetical protein